MIAVTKGKLTGSRAANDQFAGKNLLAYGVAGAFNAADHLFNRGIADLPGGLFEGGDAYASKFCSLQFIKAE